MRVYIVLVLIGIGWSCSPKPPKFNVLYISIEDVMPSFGCYGDSIAYTPHLDSFSRESVLFEDVHCQVALCTPSRTSILTGIRPSTSGIVKIDDPWRAILPNAVSLPRHFRDHGYYTSIAGKIHDYRSGETDSAYIKTIDIHGLKSNERAYEALEDALGQPHPFFLAIGYSQAHDPWTPSEEAQSHYSIDQFSAKGRASMYKKKPYDAAGIKELQRKYYGEVTEVDSLIGGVLERIRKNGLYENTIILIGAMDHGYNLGHRNRFGKGNAYDNETRVPLWVRVPGNTNNGSRAAGIVELVDIYPTLVDVCQLPLPKQELEGYSFVPLLKDPSLPWKKAAFVHRAYAVDIVGVKTKSFNLIDFAGDSVQLFDRKKDPNNLRNIAAENSEVVHMLQRIKRGGWRNALPDKN